MIPQSSSISVCHSVGAWVDVGVAVCPVGVAVGVPVGVAVLSVAVAVAVGVAVAVNDGAAVGVGVHSKTQPLNTMLSTQRRSVMRLVETPNLMANASLFSTPGSTSDRSTTFVRHA